MAAGGSAAHIAAAEHKLAMGSIIRELAGYAGADDPAALAEELSVVMEGAYVTRQVTRSQDTGVVVRRLTQVLVDRRLPNPASAP